MTYRWALSGVLERPYYVPEDRFIFPLPRNGKENSDHIQLSALTKVYEKAAFRDGLTIAAGRSIEMPVTLALFDGEKQIASVEHSRAHTLEEYRGRGIMSELIAEFEVYDPTWMLMRADNLVQLSYTPAAEAALRKAYRLMVQRGAIVPSQGDNSWQKVNSPFLRSMSRMAASR